MSLELIILWWLNSAVWKPLFLPSFNKFFWCLQYPTTLILTSAIVATTNCLLEHSQQHRKLRPFHFHQGIRIHSQHSHLQWPFCQCIPLQCLQHNLCTIHRAHACPKHAMLVPLKHAHFFSSKEVTAGLVCYALFLVMWLCELLKSQKQACTLYCVPRLSIDGEGRSMAATGYWRANDESFKLF